MKIIYWLFFSTLLYGCKSRKETDSSQAVKKIKKEEEKIYYETLSKNVYVNDYFDLKFAFPKNWVVVTPKEDFRSTIDTMRNSGDNNILIISRINREDTINQFSPNIILFLTKNDVFNPAPDEETHLKEFADYKSKKNPETSFYGEVYKETDTQIGFMAIQAKTVVNNREIPQIYCAKFCRNSYILGMIVTCYNKEQLADIKQVLSGMRRKS